MNDTFINIGNVIKNNDSARIKYHPLIKEAKNLIEKNKPIDNIVCFKMTVDFNKEKVFFDENVIMQDRIKCIFYSESASNGHSIPDLIGNIYLGEKKVPKNDKDFLDLFTFNYYKKKYVKKYLDVLTDNSFISKYRKIIDDNIKLIENVVSNVKLNYQETNAICFYIDIEHNNTIKAAHEYIECLDEIDEMFLNLNKTDGGYIFKKNFYGMFSLSKMIKYSHSIPSYNKNNFLSLYYSYNIYDNISMRLFNNEYKISVFPNYDKLDIYDIDNLIFDNINIFNFNELCDKIMDVINQKNSIDFEEKKIMPILLKFDVYYRYDNGQARNQNMLALKSVRYSNLLKIRDRLNINEQFIEYYDKKTEAFKTYDRLDLRNMLIELYKDDIGDIKKNKKIVFNLLQNYFMGKYDVPSYTINNVINKTLHLYRIGKENDSKTLWNKLFQIYKYLKIVENNSYMKNLIEQSSFKYGEELAKIELSWRDDRKNVKKFIDIFHGNITRRIYSVSDIRKYYGELISRLKRNNAYIDSHDKLIQYLKSIDDEEFDKTTFVIGYLTEKNTYKNNKQE